ncbi:hypothetical protein A4R26_24645 [Niastella populi]|uniref:Uncharacterized protein n=1 Tax=Niastella populi TaxID=550983 RepID=A0A1V9FGE6_9BACT|nr:hypothetical protein A4R26_24645 [Niastella populi]
MLPAFHLFHLPGYPLLFDYFIQRLNEQPAHQLNEYPPRPFPNHDHYHRPLSSYPCASETSAYYNQPGREHYYPAPLLTYSL